MIQTRMLEFKTAREGDILNISEQVQRELTNSGAKEGTIALFVQSTTSSLTIIEYEEGILSDLRDSFERLAPKSAQYEHERAWHDGNGHSHIRSALIGVSLMVPFKKGELMLGTWQQIVLCEFDVRPRLRKVIMQVIIE